MANPAGQPGTIVDGNYVPNFPPERSFYEAMWKYVNPNGNETLPGQDAVPFFQKSEVDIGILRQIWSLSTVANVMKKENFFTALRYITMVQNGEIPLNKEKLESSCGIQFPPPKFVGVQLPTPPPAVQLPPPQAYAMTPEEITKYGELFKTYDTSNVGVLPQSILMPIFLKSGLPPPVINSVWVMSDMDKDSMLSSVEFSVAFHLILCLSKKHLPLPPGLPAPLIAICKQQQTRPQSQPPSSLPPTKETSRVEISALPEPIDNRQAHVDTQSMKPVQSAESSGSLKYLLQRVATEKISLSASVTNSESDIESIKERLSASLSEINGLQTEIEEIKSRLLESYRQRGALQVDEIRAKADRDRLVLVVTEGRRELARLAGDSIEPSPLLFQISDKIAQSSADSMRHSGSGSNESSSLNAELDSLRTLMQSLALERARVVEESSRLKNNLFTVQSSLNSYNETVAAEKAELEALRAQNLQLRATLEASLQQLATHNAVSVTSPAHVPPPQKIQSQQQGIAVLSVESTSNGTGFDAGFAEPSHSSSGFVEPSGSGDFKSFETDGFHSFGASSTPADGFAAFSGAQGSVTSAHNDGFAAFGGDDFGSSAQPSTGFDNGFGNFGGDGFSSFGQSSTGFAAFEAPASTSQASSAFDAFNF